MKIKTLNLKSLFLTATIICVGMLFGNIGTASAAVSYDAETNTIYLESGTNTLASIYSGINNPAVLSYDSVTNTYTLSASISGKDNTPADLVLEDATLIFNNTAVNSYYIKTWRHLTIKSMIIKPANYEYIWHIHAYAQYGNPYSLEITGSDISGGWVQAQSSGGWAPSTPIIIKDNLFHDTTMENPLSNYPLTLWYNAAENAYLYNNVFENIHITTGRYNGILGFNNCADMTIDGLYIYDCSVNSYGMTYFYGESDGVEITNFEIENCVGNGLIGKEYNKVTFANGVIRGVSKSGIHMYVSQDYGKGYYWIADVIIDGATTGIQTNPFTDITADIYNVRINDVGTAFTTYYTSVFYVTNSLATNYLKEYYITDNAEVRRYQLTDIYVTDENGNPVESATVTIEAISPDVSDPIINRKLEPIAQTATLTNGHTPLPNEDEDNTIALLSRRVTSSTNTTYSYNVTAEKDGYTNTVTVNPDDNWYRTDPNTYENTITIVLDTIEPDTTPPARSNGSPAGTLSSGTTSTSISLTTNENADCKYSTNSNTSYATMTGALSADEAGTSHSTTISGLSDGNTYTYYVRCIDSSSNANTNDYSINFSVDEAGTPPPPPPLAQELIAHYKFDENIGTTATDSSENNNNGTLTNMDTSTAWVSGKVDGGLEFDGNNDYIQILDSTGLDNITQEITLMAWIKAPIGTRQTIFDRWLYGTEINERSFEFDISSNGTINFALSSDGTGNTDQWLASNTAITSNEWTHITSTSDGTTMKIYINGEQDSNTSSAPTGGIYQSTADMHIGSWWGGESWLWPFHGSIDEVRIYNYALTPAEILSNYNEGNEPQENHLPIGSLDTADQTLITGWAYDANSNPIDVHIYIDGNLIDSATANQSRPDLVSAGVCPDPNHGFSFSTPADLSIGDHTVNVYAINYPEGTNPELIGSPIIFNIPNPPPSPTPPSPDPTPTPDPTPPAPTPTPAPDPLPPPTNYPELTLLKTPDSFKIYIIINQKKKWIPTPEVFETLGYQWTEITEIEKNQLTLIPDYEDNLIRAINDYKVYLIVNGIKRHLPNPEIFLNYGFVWEDVKEVSQETINQYTESNLIKESKKEEIYYLDPARKIKRWLRSPEIFNSYNNKWEDIQVISKYEMDHYPESNLIQLIGDNNVYLIENNRKRLINSVEEFEKECSVPLVKTIISV